MLLYATGGVSFLEAKGSFAYEGSIPANPTTVSGSGNWSDTLVGFTVGGGVESDVSSLFGIPGVKVRAEYRYTSYGNYSKDIALGCSGVCNAITAPSNNAHIEVSNIDNHKFMLGVGFELGNVLTR
jgi:opacity protein-like surface antigen